MVVRLLRGAGPPPEGCSVPAMYPACRHHWSCSWMFSAMEAQEPICGPQRAPVALGRLEVSSSRRLAWRLTAPPRGMMHPGCDLYFPPRSSKGNNKKLRGNKPDLNPLAALRGLPIPTHKFKVNTKWNPISVRTKPMRSCSRRCSYQRCPDIGRAI